MNKLKYIAGAMLVLGTIYSCKKDTLLTYNMKDNIYFNWVQQVTVRLDSLDISFAYSPDSVKDSTIMVPVAVTGIAANTDRTFNVTVDPASTEAAGSHYVLPSTFVVHAGRLLDSFPVKLLRTADLQDTTETLILDLDSNSNFNTAIKNFPASGVNDSTNALQLRFFVSDILTAGPYWNSIFAAYFGTFSVKKLKLLNQVTGMPLNYVTTGWLTDLNLNAHAAYYAIAMSRYLQDRAAAGTPVYEADGVTLMTMAAAYQ